MYNIAIFSKDLIMSPWEVPGWAKDTAGDALKNARAIR